MKKPDEPADPRKLLHTIAKRVLWGDIQPVSDDNIKNQRLLRVKKLADAELPGMTDEGLYYLRERILRERKERRYDKKKPPGRPAKGDDDKQEQQRLAYELHASLTELGLSSKQADATVGLFWPVFGHPLRGNTVREYRLAYLKNSKK